MAKTGGKVKRLREIAKRKAMVVSHGGFGRFAANDQNPNDRRAGGDRQTTVKQADDLVALSRAALASGITVTVVPSVKPRDKYEIGGFTTANRLHAGRQPRSEVYNWLV